MAIQGKVAPVERGVGIGNRSRRRRDWIALVGAIVVIAGAAFWNSYALRTATRWLLWSGTYKQRVLVQAPPPGGQLKHLAWDAWGFPGAGRTVIYLVHDPADGLAGPADSGEAGKFNGLPCEVVWVRRQESQWYTVRFQSEEMWGRKNRLDCTGRGE